MFIHLCFNTTINISIPESITNTTHVRKIQSNLTYNPLQELGRTTNKTVYDQ